MPTLTITFGSSAHKCVEKASIMYVVEYDDPDVGHITHATFDDYDEAVEFIHFVAPCCRTVWLWRYPQRTAPDAERELIQTVKGLA
mgnify:CR=1 FL=1